VSFFKISWFFGFKKYGTNNKNPITLSWRVLVMSNRKPLKNRVFGISKELDELLNLYSQRMEISLSEFIRNSIEEKIEKLKQEEQKFWVELPEKKMTDILSSLTEYLCSKISDEDLENCKKILGLKNLNNQNRRV